MRALALILLVANLGFFAWREGWLAPVVAWGVLPSPSDGREPQRLRQQVKPELIRLAPQAAAALASPAASAPQPAASAAEPAALATSCLEAAPIAAIDRSRLDELLRRQLPEGSWEWRPIERLWWVAMGPYPDLEAITRKREELRRRGIAPTEERPAPNSPMLLVLGRHITPAAAQQQLDGLAARDVRTARVVQVNDTQRSQWQLVVPRADAKQLDALGAVSRNPGAPAFLPCATVPAVSGAAEGLHRAANG